MSCITEPVVKRIPLSDRCQLTITYMDVQYQVKHMQMVYALDPSCKCAISHPLTWGVEELPILSEPIFLGCIANQISFSNFLAARICAPESSANMTPRLFRDNIAKFLWLPSLAIPIQVIPRKLEHKEIQTKEDDVLHCPLLFLPQSFWKTNRPGLNSVHTFNLLIGGRT